MKTLQGRRWRPVLLDWIERAEQQAECEVQAVASWRDQRSS
jgi:hypothetical protein